MNTWLPDRYTVPRGGLHSGVATIVRNTNQGNNIKIKESLQGGTITEINDKKNNMWPIVIGAGAAALLIKALFSGTEYSKKRIFISFAIEDKKYRDFLVAQAKNEKTPFTFVDMSVKQPWNEKIWKLKCRTKIKSCDGMIVLLSGNTWHSSGARWEIKCAREEGIPVIGMHIQKDNKSAIPPELKGKKVITWSWNNLASAIDKI